MKLGSANMIQKPRCSQWSGCFRTSPLPQNTKDHPAHRRKWVPASSENQAMSPPFILRTDRLSLWTGTGITISQRSSKLGTSAARRWDSVALFFIMIMPVPIQQQTMADFLNESKVQLLPHQPYSPDCLPATSSYFQKWRTTEGYPVWECRSCVSSVHKGCWRHTQINLGRGVK